MNKVDFKKPVSFSNLLIACLVVIIINFCLTLQILQWNNERRHAVEEAVKAQIELEK